MLLSLALTAALAPPTVWRVDQTGSIAGHTPTVLGAPRAVESPHGKVLSFDGVRDGLIVPANPLAGCEVFTIEVLFRPAAGGPEEQRFLHVEDESGARALIETRLTPDGQWALDTFLLSGENRLPLLDRTRLHPANTWHWVALRYDGRRLSSFVNGVKELEGEVAFPPMKPGRVSLGVRQNLVYWFKGEIAEVRFHPVSLPEAQMQRVPLRANPVDPSPSS